MPKWDSILKNYAVVAFWSKSHLPCAEAELCIWSWECTNGQVSLPESNSCSSIDLRESFFSRKYYGYLRVISMSHGVISEYAE
jgi:hypothetical protein